MTIKNILENKKVLFSFEIFSKFSLDKFNNV